MVRDWSRQAARATGVSLLGPLVLLVAAAVVASGGGLGGLGALGQVAGGPALPDTGVLATAPSPIDEADIVGADPLEAVSAAAAPAPGGTSAAAPSAPGGGGGLGGGVEVTPLPRPLGPSPPSQPAPGGPATGAPPPAGGAPSGGPVDELIEDVRGVGESLPGPLGPTTGDILDLLLPPGAP